MMNRWALRLLLLTLCLFSFWLLNQTRRPLCIDSKSVERIDKISPGEIDTVFRCAINKKVPYSSFFAQQLPDLKKRINNLERILSRISPLKKRVKILVLSQSQSDFLVADHNIYISEELLKLPGHLEKAIAKVWYRELSVDGVDRDELFEEFMTDIVLFLVNGEINISDSEQGPVTKIDEARWPYILKSQDGYCESPWKRSEDILYCQQSDLNSVLPEQFVHRFSLRPFLVSAWIKAYSRLSEKDKYNLLPSIGNSMRIPQESRTLDSSREPEVEDKQILSASIRDIRNTLQKWKKLNNTVISQFEAELKLNDDAVDSAYFDFLFVRPGHLTKEMPEMQNLIRLAKQNPGSSMAIMNSDRIWMLPSAQEFSVENLGEIRSRHAIVENCGNYDFNLVFNYQERAEKLLVIDNCNPQKTFSFDQFIKKGVQGFAAQNKNVSFVQFHLPSALLRKNELQKVSNVSEFLQVKDDHNASFKSLGWQYLEKHMASNSYQPKAFIDAIEWFRIQTN